MNKIFVQLLEKRGLKDDFLNPDYTATTDPFVLPDMTKTVNRIKQAVKNHEKILIYGDYDVDGITASTVMEQTLKLAGVKPENLTIMLPDRFVDGYGMSPRLVDRAKDQKINLVITVDCGSRNHDIVKALNDLHIDTIITDHHECADTLPEAIAVINPKRPDFTDDPHKLKNLAGVGVAFKLAQALTKNNLIPNGQEKWLLDLVLIGTICDRMTLTHENRTLCYYGLKVLAKTRRKGLKELMATASVNPAKITADSISFQIGPRLNAAGRLETAEIALDLLRTDQSTTASKLAAELEKLNKKRRTEQRQAVAEITERSDLMARPVIIEAGDWHEGIIGIVAGRLVEKYHRPAFVLTKTDQATFKGSGRSFGDFSLAEAIKHADVLGGGGHAAAAGVQIAADKLNDFTTQINDYYTSLHLPDQSHFLRKQADLDLDGFTDCTLELLEDFQALEPFGDGNPEPIFRITANILNSRRMGSTAEHLSLDVKARDGKTMKLIAFGAPESWFALDYDAPHDFLIQLTEDNFRGVRSVEARLLDVDVQRRRKIASDML